LRLRLRTRRDYEGHAEPETPPDGDDLDALRAMCAAAWAWDAAADDAGDSGAPGDRSGVHVVADGDDAESAAALQRLGLA
jgi:hypothetical protein